MTDEEEIEITKDMVEAGLEEFDRWLIDNRDDVCIAGIPDIEDLMRRFYSIKI